MGTGQRKSRVDLAGLRRADPAGRANRSSAYDDTGVCILKLALEPAPEGKAERTGTFTSGIVSRPGARFIAVFFGGWKHARENLAEVLSDAPGLQPLIHLCEALSRNTPKLSECLRLLLANCLAHGRRQLVEVADFSGRMPFRAGDAGRRFAPRRIGPPAEADAGRAVALPSGTQRAVDEDLKRMAGGATGRTQN